MAVSVNLYGVQTLKPTTDNVFMLSYNSNVRPENNNEVRLLVDTSLQVVPSPVNLYLPPISGFNGIYTIQIYVVDIAGSAGAFPIIINPYTNDEIDGGTSIQIDTANGNVVLTIASEGYWTSYGSAAGGGGGGAVITTNYNNFYNQMSNGQLVTGTKYRITDYQNVNFLNGLYNAVNEVTPATISAGGYDGTFKRWDGSNVQFAAQNATGNLYVANGSGGLFNKLDANGNPDAVFNANVGTGGSGNGINGIAFQSDGKIVVTGNFNLWNGTPAGGIVRLNSNGTVDNTFLTNTGTGFNTTAFQCLIQPDGKIIVVGTFSSFNGTPTAFGIIRLTTTGFIDAAFDTNLAAGLTGGTAYACAIQADGKILVVGDFLTCGGVPSRSVTRINTDGTVDNAFCANVDPLFNNTAQCVAIQADQKIIVGGSFTSGTYNKIIRLNTDGTEDVGFTANFLTGLNDTVISIAIASGGDIVCGGDFSLFDGNPTGRVIRISSTGVYDNLFMSYFNSRVWSVIIQASGAIVVGGDFTNQGVADYLARLSDVPFLIDGSNYDEIYTSPTTEVLIVTANSPFTTEPIAYSETFPTDVLQYNSQYQGIGTAIEVYDTAVLPDSTVVSGFDLQWDGTNAYFLLPANYPVTMGAYFYIYADFNSGDYIDSYFENFSFITNYPTDNYGQFPITASTDNGQIKIVVGGVTNQMVLDYVAGSLYVEYQQNVQPCTGLIVRRNNVVEGINLPYDWRTQTFRRYQGILSTTIPSLALPSFMYVIGTGSVTYTGLFVDLKQVRNYYNFDVTQGLANCRNYSLLASVLTNPYWYGQYMDNNVVLQDAFESKITITDVCTNNTSSVSRRNIISSNYYFGNFIFNDFSGCNFDVEIFAANYIDFFLNVSGKCRNFIFCQSFVFSETLLPSDEIAFSTVRNITRCRFGVQVSGVTGNVLDFVTVDNRFVNTVFTSIVSSSFYDLVNNTILGGGDFNMEDCHFNVFNGNGINSAFFRTCKGNNFVGNSITSPQIYLNDFGFSFENNNIDAVAFTNNTFGFFTQTTISASGVGFLRNRFYGSQANGNFNASAGVYDNVISVAQANGNNYLNFFENNIQCGKLVGNTFSNNFSTNDINCYSFELNNFGNVNVTRNVISGRFYGNNIAIGAIATRNMLLNTLNSMEACTIGGDFTYNVVEQLNGIATGNFTFTNNRLRNFILCTLTGAFQGNNIPFDLNAVDFSLSTHVYATYTKYAMQGTLGAYFIQYYDQGTGTIVTALLTA